jgi:CDP-diacylglycerol--glycerol-3-phosphate 3-phosphatidyltransferase
MISTYKIKPLFQKMLMPLLKLLRKLGVSPNALTLLAVLLSLLIGWMFWNSSENNIYFLLVALGLLLRMMLNALDGMMARIYNLQSKVGEILNEVGDIISDVVIFFPLIVFEGLDIRLAIAFITLSVINEFCGVMAKIVSGDRRYDGPMGKSDRATLIGVICISAYFTSGIYDYVNYVIGASSFLVVISSFLRLKNALNKSN